MVEALYHYDKDGLIFKTMENIINGTYSDIFEDTFKKFGAEIILKYFSPKLSLDHNLPARLELIPIEKEVFYILHIICYLTPSIYEHYKVLHDVEKIMILSIMKKRSKVETGNIMKDHICQDLLNRHGMSCISLTNTTTWMNCQLNESIPLKQEWCNDCKNLSDCLGDKNHVYSLLKFNLKIFYSWRKYFTKKNLIDASMTSFLYHPSGYPFSVMGDYFRKIKPFPNSNLTLLDAWIYANGVYDKSGPFIKLTNKLAILALQYCSENQYQGSCLMVERFQKEIGTNNTSYWETLAKDIYDDLIPLCSFASDNLVLKRCKLFKKMSNGQCFTFNESTFDHRVGRTQGVNFLVNYDYPMIRAEMNNPVTIILHEPNQEPDIKNIMGKNFHVAPGHIMDLKFVSTVSDSTKDFDDMNFESRLCNTNMEQGEIECLMDQIHDRARTACGCKPWYNYNISGQQCNTLGTICYEKEILNGTRDMDLKDHCYESCKNVKYSMYTLENSLMDVNLNLENYGEEFLNHYLKSERLHSYMGNFDTQNKFLAPKLKKTSLVHINFEESKVFTVTKDAKITMPDMIGNVGGTLGVFIGFSFLGLLDVLIESIQYLQRKIKSLGRKKSV